MRTILFNATQEQAVAAVQVLVRLEEQANPLSRSQRQMKVAQRWLGQLLFGIFILMPLLVILTSTARINSWSALYFTVVAYCAGALVVHAQRPKPDPRLQALQQGVLIQLRDGFVEVQMGSTVSTTPWAAFRSVLLDDLFVMLLLKDGSAMWVPCSAFSTDESMRKFTAEASALLKASRSSSDRAIVESSG
jgi:hypothetical protein